MKNKVLIIIAFVIFALGIAGIIAALNMPSRDTVIIRRDDTILYTINLKTTPDKIFDIEYRDSKNTVEIKDGKIRVKDADCPDRICVNTGWLSSAAIPIVCLPNHLVIEFKDSGETDAAAR